MAQPDTTPLTTLTLTHRERVVLSRALTITAALVDALGDDKDKRELLSLWERIHVDGDDS